MNKVFQILLCLLIINICVSCKKESPSNPTSLSDEKVNYISFKQDGNIINIDSVKAESMIFMPNASKLVKVLFLNKSGFTYDFSLIDSNMSMGYLTPKRYQGNGNSFIHINQGKVFAGIQSKSYFVCTTSDSINKSFSGYFEITFVNPPNSNDTIQVKDGIFKNVILK
jgi:hypothetical protein